MDEEDTGFDINALNDALGFFDSKETTSKLAQPKRENSNPTTLRSPRQPLNRPNSPPPAAAETSIAARVPLNSLDTPTKTSKADDEDDSTEELVRASGDEKAAAPSCDDDDDTEEDKKDSAEEQSSLDLEDDKKDEDSGDVEKSKEKKEEKEEKIDEKDMVLMPTTPRGSTSPRSSGPISPRDALSPRSAGPTSPRGLVSPRGLTSPRPEQTESHLMTMMRARQGRKNKKEFTEINLDALSAMALAEIKRFSLSSKCLVQVDVVKAEGLYGGKNPPCPMCLLAIRKDTSKDHEKKIEVKKQHEATEPVQKSTDPVFNAHFDMHVDQIKGQSQRWLVIELRDKSPKGACLGFVEINLNNNADLVQREEWYDLERRAKKDKVSGKILVKFRICPEERVEETIVIKDESFPTIPSFIYSSYWNSHCTKTLSITGCGITSVPEGIYNLSSLLVLILSNNSLSSLPKTIGRIYSLKVLDIRGNKLTTLPDELTNLKNLQQLMLEDNNFAETEVPNCVFDLDVWCEISGKPAGWFSIIELEIERRDRKGGAVDSAAMADKEKEIQRLLEAMK